MDASMQSSMLVSSLSPYFLDTYSLSMSSLGRKDLCIVISFPVVFSICWNSFLVHFKNGSEYLTRETAMVSIPLMRFCCWAWFRDFFFSFSFFLHLYFFNGICFQYHQLLVIFLFFERSDSFLICQFYSFCCFSFVASHYFHVKFHSNILNLYSYYVHQSLQFFSFLLNFFLCDSHWLWLSVVQKKHNSFPY